MQESASPAILRRRLASSWRESKAARSSSRSPWAARLGIAGKKRLQGGGGGCEFLLERGELRGPLLALLVERGGVLLVERVELVAEGEDLGLERLLDLMEGGLVVLLERGGVVGVLALEVAISLEKRVGMGGGRRNGGGILHGSES